MVPAWLGCSGVPSKLALWLEKFAEELMKLIHFKKNKKSVNKKNEADAE